MGVSSSEKSTIGKLLSYELNIPFFDGDDFHQKESVEKMSSGQPLNDNDWQNWLEILEKSKDALQVDINLSPYEIIKTIRIN